MRQWCHCDDSDFLAREAARFPSTPDTGGRVLCIWLSAATASIVPEAGGLQHAPVTQTSPKPERVGVAV